MSISFGRSCVHTVARGRSTLARTLDGILPLKPMTTMDRRLSATEYFFASMEVSAYAKPVVVTHILEGDGPTFTPDVWRAALDHACRANPGSRLRLVGRLLFARWASDGQKPALRVIDHLDWTGMSQEGSEFLDATKLSADGGPTVELILVNGSPRGKLVIIRALHTVMDGRGAQHFLADVFRSLRNESPLGTNADFTCEDLARQVKPSKDRWPAGRRARPGRLTGPPLGPEGEDEWRRVRLHTTGRNILPRIAQVLLEYVQQRNNDDVLFWIPVDLRRHVPNLLSTANFAGGLVLRLEKGESALAFRKKLDDSIARRDDTRHNRRQNLGKLFPRNVTAWINWHLARLGRRRRPVVTANISSYGRVDIEKYRCEYFRARSLTGIPFPGTSLTLIGVNNHIEATIRMPRVYASNGRLDDFVGFLVSRLPEIET